MFFSLFVYLLLSEDLLPRLWGWDRLVPLDIIYVPWTEYINYLQVYYSYNAKLLPATAAAAETVSNLLPLY